MWLDRTSNPGPLALESDGLPTALHDPALTCEIIHFLVLWDEWVLSESV